MQSTAGRLNTLALAIVYGRSTLFWLIAELGSVGLQTNGRATAPGQLPADSVSRLEAAFCFAMPPTLLACL